MDAQIKGKIAGLKAVIEYRLEDARKEINKYVESKGRYEFYKESAKSSLSYADGIIFAIETLGYHDKNLALRVEEVFQYWLDKCHQDFE